MPPRHKTDGASVLATALLATVAGCAAALSPPEQGREMREGSERREGSANGSDPFSWWIALVVLGAVNLLTTAALTYFVVWWSGLLNRNAPSTCDAQYISADPARASEEPRLADVVSLIADVKWRIEALDRKVDGHWLARLSETAKTGSPIAGSATESPTVLLTKPRASAPTLIESKVGYNDLSVVSPRGAEVKVASRDKSPIGDMRDTHPKAAGSALSASGRRSAEPELDEAVMQEKVAKLVAEVLTTGSSGPLLSPRSRPDLLGESGDGRSLRGRTTPRTPRGGIGEGVLSRESLTGHKGSPPDPGAPRPELGWGEPRPHIHRGGDGPYSDVWHNGPIQGSQRLAKEPGKRDLWTQEAERVRELEWERDRERNRSRTRSPQFSMSQPRGRGYPDPRRLRLSQGG